MKRIALLLLTALVMIVTTDASAQILTKSYDAQRTSETRVETTLTPAAVRAKGLTKLPNIPVIGDAIGEEAQPLIDGAVMILPSEGNVIRGVTPNGGAAIWQTPQLCVPIRSDRSQYGNDMWGTNDHFGMMSTGVIDGDTHKLYQVAFCSADGSGGYPSGVEQRMFVLDTRTGNVISSQILTGSSNGYNYQDAPRKQRSALLLWKMNGVKFVIVMAGSFAETGANATGWLLAFDTYDNRFKAALSTHAGGWMSGQGPAFDPATGLIYLGLGNGPYNATTAFGEANLQVKFVPPTATTTASLTVAHAWAPFLDTLRTSSTAPTPAVTGAASMPGMAGMDMAGAAKPALLTGGAWGDQDAVLSGTLLLAQHLYVTAGKDGMGYVIPTANFPDTAVLDFGNPKANCAKVRIYWFGWNVGTDPCPTDQRALNVAGFTRHQHAPIVQYHAANGATYLTFGAENSPVQVWQVNADGSMKYVARGTETASSQVNGGMPGTFCSVSNNAGANAILWCSMPWGDANKTRTTGRLIAYDLTAMAGGKLPTLWTSTTYSYSKFSQSVVYNGTVILPDGAGSVMEWRLGQ